MGLLSGCVASFRAEQMGLKEFPEGRRRGSTREGPGAAFLSRWPIHKTPPLPSPDGAGHCLVFPHLRGAFLSKAGGGARSAKKVAGASSSELHPFHCSPRSV